MPDDVIVLNFCNDVRKELRRGPVKGLRMGTPGGVTNCPVAATINYGCRNLAEVDDVGVFYGPTVVSKCPAHIRDFIQSFDDGQLPEYEGQGWAE